MRIRALFTHTIFLTAFLTVFLIPTTVPPALAQVSPPEANAGIDRTVVVGELVVLDGTRSVGTGAIVGSGDMFILSWSLVSAPAGSAAALTGPTQMKPTFRVDQPGDYVIQLVVTEGTAVSAPDTVTISTDNSAPVADPGLDRKILAGQIVQLDGGGSWDFDGDRLSYAWTLVSAPAGSGAAISDPAAVRPTFAASLAGDYVAQLVVSDGARSSDPKTVTFSTENLLPVTDAGADELARSLVGLIPDGYRSSDPDGDALSYKWSVLWGPDDGIVSIAAETERRAAFALFGGGIYVLQLVASSGRRVSGYPDTMVYLADGVGNLPPVANAGPDQAIAAGATVRLDATKSHDINGGSLKFRWSLISVPDGSLAAISDPTAARPSFTADLPGSYVAQLIASDGIEYGMPDTVIIGTGNLPPVANAGPDQLDRGPTPLIQLNGSGSSDANGDALIYRWSLIELPARSRTALSDPGAANPTFTADQPGVYIAQLHVGDGISESPADTVIISTESVATAYSNGRPIANAGTDRDGVLPGSTVALNGNGSSDLEGTALSYRWALIVRPNGSTAALSGASAVNSSFVADRAGLYVAQLIVRDGQFYSDPPDTVVIEIVNRAPIANAGPDQSVLAGATAQLDGSGSTDPDGDLLSYSWTLTAKPPGSKTAIIGATTAGPTIVPDYDGVYTATLTVSDGEFTSTDSVSVTATNQPPVLDLIGPQAVDLGSTLRLTLSATDANPGTTLAFSASPLPLPAGASLNGTTGEFTFKPDETQVGTLALIFSVSDGLLTDSESVSITVNGAPVGGVTAISGRILDTNDYVRGIEETGVPIETPVIGATVSVLDAPTVTAVSDINGNFTLSGVPAGSQVFNIDPTTAQAGPDPINPTYAGFREELTLIADVTNTIDRPLFLPRVESESLTTIDPAFNTPVRNNRLGIRIEVPRNSAVNPDGSPFIGQLSISEVPLALAPAALPDMLKPGLLITIQPVGVRFLIPARVLNFPNFDNLPVDSKVNLWSLDAASGAFGVTGTLIANSPGNLTHSDGGILAADWYFPMPGAAGLDGDNDSDCAGGSGAHSGSSTSLCTGDLSVAHDMVGYQSAGQSRSLRLVYNSTAADPRPIIRLNASLPSTLGKPRSMSMNLNVGGISLEATHITDTSGLVEGTLETVVQAYQFNAESLSTGLHRYSAGVLNNYTRSSVGVTFSGVVNVNNERGSPFGAGWTLQGLQRVVSGEEGPVISEAGGSSARMTPPGFTGNGAFAPANNYGSITVPNAFVVDDLNRDGNADLVVPDNATGEFHVLLGDGQGGFPEIRQIDADPWSVAAPDKAVAIAVGDAVRDDSPDVAVLDGVGDWIFVHPGVGENGNFMHSLNPKSSADTANALILEDFDLNGKDDLISTGSTGCTLILEIVGFTCISGIAFNSIHADYLNGDNFLDFVVTEPANGRIRAFINDGTGRFGVNAAFASGAVSAIPGRLELGTADFDRNGATDIAVVNRDAGTVSILPGNGAGGFSARTVFPAGTTPASLAVADFNSDSFADIVVVSDTTGDVSLLYGDGIGGLSAPTIITVTAGGSLTSVRVADFNDDNVADLAIANGTDGAMSVLLGLPSDTVVMTGRAGDFSSLQQNADSSFTRTFRDGRKIEFNASGHQTSTTDLAGRTVGFTYDTQDRLWTVTDEAGLITTFEYDVAGKVESITDPAGRVTRFEHDLRGDLIAITDPDDTVRRFDYDSDHLMRSQTSKRSFVTRYEYNSYGRHVRSVWPDASERLILPARTAGLPDLDTNSGTAPFIRTTDVTGTFTDGNNQTETRRLNRFGAAVEVTDAVGRKATIQRDSNDNPEKIILPEREITATYYDNGLIHTQTITDTTTHTSPYPTAGQSRTWTYTYNDQNKVETIDGPRTDVSDLLTLEYDPATGDVTTVTNALGHMLRMTAYNAFGQPLTVVGGNNVQTGLTYFPQGWLKTVTVDELGTPATYSLTYDAAGQMKTMTSPGGATLTYEYDLMGRVKTIQNDDGERIENTYDDAGNLTQSDVWSAGAPGTIVRTSSAAFDELDRLLKAIGAYAGEETLFAYDANGNVERITDPRSNATTFAYDAVDRVKAVTDALLKQSSNGYDDVGNLAMVTDQRNLETSYVYNGFGDVIQVSSPDTGATEYRYDSAGNLIQRNDPRGVETRWAYDALGRVTAITFPATPAENVTYSYDDATPGHYGIGRLASVTDESGSTTNRYDARGNIVRVDRVIGTQTYVSEYAWDADNLLIRKTFPSGRIVIYTRDLQGRVTAVRTQADALAAEVTLASAIGYEPFGPVNALTYGNGVTVSYGYDLDGRLTAIDTFNGASAVLDLDYGYDLAGNIIGIADAGGGIHGRNYGYDPVNRLNRAELLNTTGGIAEAIDYDYDAVGNRIERRIDGVIETYDYDTASNRLLSISGGVTRAFIYGVTGNVTLDDLAGAAATLTYNSMDRLVRVSAGTVVLADYTYGATGQRAVKNVAGTVTHYLYDPGGALYAETDGAGNVTREYITLGGVTLAVIDGGGTSYVHGDHLSTAQMMTDGTTGAVIWDASYRPFGEVALTAAAGALNNQRFPGQYADAETGYYDNWHRSYDPRLGRYLQSDPVGLVAGLNTYAYAGNNPVMLTDPTGQILPALIYGMMVMQGAVATIEFGMAAYFAYETVSGIMDRYKAGCRRDELVSFSDVINLLPLTRYAQALIRSTRAARATSRATGGAPALTMANRGKPAVPTRVSGPAGPGGGGNGFTGGAGGGGNNVPDEFIRVVEPGKPQFQLKQGEQGISVFDASKVGPKDILPHFRKGSETVTRTADDIRACGLTVICTRGDPSLPKNLQDAHWEITKPGGMTRNEFKKALKKLEPQ